MKYPKKKLRALPSAPGIYFFKDVKGKVLYVGKANNLRARVRQYFARSSERHPKTEALVRESDRVSWKRCESEIDALIAEARSIKKYSPKYNVILRDDKNYFFVCISKEVYPRLCITHQPPLFGSSTSKHIIGPFTDGGALKETLRLLRGAYPYCTCKPATKRACLNYHLGRCLAPCVHPDARTKTKRNVQVISAILEGKRNALLRALTARMKRASRAEEFQKASELKKQIESIQNIFSHRFFLERFQEIKQAKPRWSVVEKKLRLLLKTKKSIRRVECYDISNISGKHAVGSMVVFENGAPDKKNYRKFKIKYSGSESNDPKMMAEVLARRIKHDEWPMPDLIIVDGGQPQLSAARAVLPELQLVVGLAKKQEELYTVIRPTPTLAKSLGEETLFFVQRVRDEAHRFAIAYHRKLREIQMPKSK